MAVAELIRDIISVADASPSHLIEVERAELLAACQRLKASLETPFEATARIIFGV